MPKITQYQPNQVQTQVVDQPYAKSAPKGAFEPHIARGVMDIAQAGLDIKKRIDTTSAEEAALNFEREKNDIMFNADTGYFNTHRS